MNGNIAHEFHTKFSAAFWEIYLYRMFLSLGLTVTRPENWPDFVLGAPQGAIAASKIPRRHAVRASPPPWLNAVTATAANAAYQVLMTACWTECRRVMKDGGVMAFTFHHSADETWMSILQSPVRLNSIRRTS